MADARLPALLEEAREAIDIAPYSVVIATARQLLAALDAVLKLADDWEGKGAECRAFAAAKLECGNAIPAWISEASAGAFEGCMQALRETITCELTGKEGSDVRAE